jgi:hypothetical protein
MIRKKAISEPVWIIWEGDDFPRELHSDSIVFYLNEHVYLDDDDLARRSLVKSLLREGISTSTGQGYGLIESSTVTRAGYRYDDGDDIVPIYCDDNDPDLDYDATFVEVAYVD